MLSFFPRSRANIPVVGTIVSASSYSIATLVFITHLPNFLSSVQQDRTTNPYPLPLPVRPRRQIKQHLPLGRGSDICSL